MVNLGIIYASYQDVDYFDRVNSHPCKDSLCILARFKSEVFS